MTGRYVGRRESIQVARGNVSLRHSGATRVRNPAAGRVEVTSVGSVTIDEEDGKESKRCGGDIEDIVDIEVASFP